MLAWPGKRQSWGRHAGWRADAPPLGIRHGLQQWPFKIAATESLLTCARLWSQAADLDRPLQAVVTASSFWSIGCHTPIILDTSGHWMIPW
jgi:hypothetical protein